MRRGPGAPDDPTKGPCWPSLPLGVQGASLSSRGTAGPLIAPFHVEWGPTHGRAALHAKRGIESGFSFISPDLFKLCVCSATPTTADARIPGGNVIYNP